MTAPPGWMRPPGAEGWCAEDLDRLPEAPRHTELFDGALVLRTSHRRSWHGRLVTSLTATLMASAPTGFEVEREMTIRLDERNRPEPDLLVTTAPYDPDRTWYAPEEVQPVVEVVSPESAHRDRRVKLHKYAEAGIPHYWRVEEENGTPVAHVYELDEPTGVYAPAGIFRDTLKRPVPFEISLDLDRLTPPRRHESAEGSTRRGRPDRNDTIPRNVVSHCERKEPPLARTGIDLDDEMAAQAKEIYGTKTEAAAVRTAMEDDVRRRLRQQFIDAVKSGELDFSEIVDKAKVPDSAKGAKAT